MYLRLKLVVFVDHRLRLANFDVLTDRDGCICRVSISSEQLLDVLTTSLYVDLLQAGPRLPHQLLVPRVGHAHQLPGSCGLEAGLELRERQLDRVVPVEMQR